MKVRTAFLVFLLAAPLTAADFEAGVAKIRITPEGPIWMSGYASRNKPSEGVLTDLWAKALALKDGKGNRAVIVTTDLIGLPRSISDRVAARVLKETGLERSDLLLNSSHTHTGPVLRGNLQTMYDLEPEQWAKITAYTEKLADDLVAVILASLKDLRPAELSYELGSTAFAVNRREATAGGAIRLGVNPGGPVSHDVPVLKVVGATGETRALLFGYACHNTTLTGEHYEISGDYAGYAQAAVEESHAGTLAMFMMLCGGDANPNPRSKLENAQDHGKALAAEVGRVAAGSMRPVRAPIRSAFCTKDLAFRVHARSTFEDELNHNNPYRVRRAKAMLQAYDERRPVRSVQYPVQAIRLGRDVTFLGLGGEVVIDYQLRIEREFGKEEGIVVAGYSNDVMCYIPSLRILQEGGYEAVDSMVYYGQPGPFAGDVEERVMSAVYDVLSRVGRKPVRNSGKK